MANHQTKQRSTEAQHHLVRLRAGGPDPATAAAAQHSDAPPLTSSCGCGARRGGCGPGSAPDNPGRGAELRGCPALRSRSAASCASLPLLGALGSSPRVLPCALLPVHRARLYGDSEAHTEYVQMIFFFLQAKLKDTRLVQGPFGERGPPQKAEVLFPARGAPGAELEGGSLPFPRPPPPPRLCGHRGLHTSQPASRPNRNE